MIALKWGDPALLPSDFNSVLPQPSLLRRRRAARGQYAQRLNKSENAPLSLRDPLLDAGSYQMPLLPNNLSLIAKENAAQETAAANPSGSLTALTVFDSYQKDHL